MIRLAPGVRARRTSLVVSALGALTFLGGLYVAVVHHVIIGAVVLNRCSAT